MGDAVPYARRPCKQCPWRRDVAPGQFAQCRYDGDLRETTGAEGKEQPLGSPLFACHETAAGKEIACAGWLAVAGYTNLSVRLAISQRRLPGHVLWPQDGWPPLFTDYDEMAATQARKEE